MDENRVEEMLRGSWSPEPPDGMRERVLSRARREPRVVRLFGMPRWQAALVIASVLVVLFSGFSDSARHRRLAALGNGAQSATSRVASCPDTLWRLRFGLDASLDCHTVVDQR